MTPSAWFDHLALRTRPAGPRNTPLNGYCLNDSLAWASVLSPDAHGRLARPNAPLANPPKPPGHPPAVLIVADIIRTVVVEQTFESVTVLGIIVLIRILLSFSLDVEIDGVWPWNRLRESRNDQGS